MPPSVSPSGDVLSVDSGGLSINGTRLFAVAGEMHYSRVPVSGWAADLARLRAGGLTTVSSYVIWIHHEEAQGEFDWTGQRNLTAFLVAARAAGLLVSLRVGP